MSRTALTALVLMSVTACAQNGPADSYCLVAKPIYFAPADRMSERTEKAIIVHNETWESLCGRR